MCVCVCVCMCVCVSLRDATFGIRFRAGRVIKTESRMLGQIYVYTCSKYEFPRWVSGKELACQCRRLKRCKFDPWVRKIPWSRKG